MSFDMFSALGYKTGFYFFPLFLFFYVIWMNFFLKKKTKLTRFMSLMKFIFFSFFNEVSKSLKASMKFSSYYMSILFFFLLNLKLWKLSPYKKSFSSSMIFTLSLGFVLWLVMNVSSVYKNIFQYFSHFTPTGSPIMLIPFIKLVEMVSKIMRPITLGVRLAVNLLTGHLLVSMFTSNHSSLFLKFSMFWTLILGLIGIFMMFYESCVCVIQALVYCLMVSQYFDEHSV